MQLGYEDPAAVYAVNVVGTANRPAGGARDSRRARGRRRHVGQVLPRPGRRAALPRGRPARRLRPLLELEGRAGAGDRRVPRLARAPGRQRAGRQRDRRRRRDARPAAPRPDPRRARAASRSRSARRDARRPWQHVLNPLEGYLLLAERLAGDPSFATAFNFGPDEEPRTVGWIAERVQRGVAGRARRPLRRAPAACTRPRSPASTPPARARGWAGRRRGTSRPRST